MNAGRDSAGRDGFVRPPALTLPTRAGESQMSMGDCAKDRNRFLRGSLIREALDGNADYDFARGSRSARFQRAVRMLGDVVHFARRDSVCGEILRGYS